MKKYLLAKYISTWVCILALFGVHSACAQHHYLAPPTTPPAAQLHLPRTALKLGTKIIEVQVASTPQQLQKGLMHRLNMPDDEGMLFVFEQASVQCFWMRNTQLALTAAFVRSDGGIVNLADMQPLDETSHCSIKPVLYVLEMNQGWFQRNNIAAKALITLRNGKPLSTLRLK